jgi:hypothetical protein
MAHRQDLSPEATHVVADPIAKAIAQFKQRFPIALGEKMISSQQVALLFALLERVATHAREYGNPCLVAGQMGLDAFAYDFWYETWRSRGGTHNAPLAEPIRKAITAWRIEVVNDAPKRKRMLMRDAAGLRPSGSDEGFTFEERVADTSLGEAVVRFSVRRSSVELSAAPGKAPSPLEKAPVLLIDAAVSRALPHAAFAPNFADPRVELVESKYEGLERAADDLEKRFVRTQLSEWKRKPKYADGAAITIYRRVADYTRAMAVRGFANATLLIVLVILVISGAGYTLWYQARVKAVVESGIFVLSAQPSCEGSAAVVDLRAVLPLPGLAWVLYRDGEVLHTISANDIRPTTPNIQPSPVVLSFPENFQFVDRSVAVGETHVYSLAVRLPFGRIHRANPGGPTIVRPCS